jgi:hypothetical protein
MAYGYSAITRCRGIAQRTHLRLRPSVPHRNSVWTSHTVPCIVRFSAPTRNTVSKGLRRTTSVALRATQGTVCEAPVRAGPGSVWPA